MKKTTLKTEMVLTLTQKNLYCILFQDERVYETFVFSSIDPFNNQELKDFLNIHRPYKTSIIIGLPNVTIDHLKLSYLPWWKQKIFFLKNYFNLFLYKFPSGIPYSHGHIHFEESFWKEWNAFIQAQHYVYRHIVSLPLLWGHFPFEKYTTKQWIIVVWQTPENDLRYFVFFKKTLVYYRFVKEIPLNLEEELFNLHTYLKRDYAFDPADSAVIVIDFIPDHPLSAFDFDQEPIAIGKNVLLHFYELPSDAPIYALHYPFLQSFEHLCSRLGSWIFSIRFSAKNRQDHFIKNMHKGLLGIFIYFCIRCAYLAYQSHTLEKTFISLTNENPLAEFENPLPADVLKSLIDSMPSQTDQILNFFKKRSVFYESNVQIEGWEWKNLDHRSGYKICLHLQLDLEEGQDKKTLFKNWKDYFKPLLLTVVKKKLLRKAYLTDGRQKWSIDIDIETPIS